MHYERWRIHGDVNHEKERMPEVCTLEDCDLPTMSGGLCSKHYTRQRRHGDPKKISRRPPGFTDECEVTGCDRRKNSEKYCSAHHKRVLAHGDPGPAKIREKRGPAPEDAKCSVDGCDAHPKGRGYCELHYGRWLSRGNVGGVEKERKPGDRPCSVEGCDTKVDHFDYCGAHARRFKLYGDPLAYAPPPEHGGTCTLDGCDEPHHAHGYCGSHATRFKKYGDPTFSPRVDYGDTCSVEDCDESQKLIGYCYKHAARVYRHGDPQTVHRIGYDKKAPGVLYLIRDEDRVKVGIASSLNDRVVQHDWHTDVVDTVEASMGEVQKLERWILDALDACGILRGRDVWSNKFDGYTETWSREQLDPESVGDLVAWLSINGDFEETYEQKRARRNRRYKTTATPPKVGDLGPTAA